MRDRLKKDATKFLQSNGLRMAYEEFGDPADPAILLVAGLYNQLVRWPLKFCELLVANGFRVIRFDNRDIGLTDKMDGVRAPSFFRLALKHYLRIPISAPYSLDDMADDTVGVLDALNIQQAHIVGMSMGGMISQLVTAKYPHRILSLTSIMSTSGERGKGVASAKVSAAMLQPVTKERSALDNAVNIWQLIGSPAYPMSDDDVRTLIKAEHKRASNPAGYMRQIAAIRTAPGRAKLLRAITAPVLIIHGNQDLLVPVSGGVDTAKHIAHAQLELFEGMGHTLPAELLPRFVELIVATTQKV
ncbi:MAG: alpha/beta hydrolase [Porticoccaceae bacterium]|nr:alpha/beta hydrolase [Porticoccaceae bacterium]